MQQPSATRGAKTTKTVNSARHGNRKGAKHNGNGQLAAHREPPTPFGTSGRAMGIRIYPDRGDHFKAPFCSKAQP